jgi:Ca2+-binding RTX toxin-like protein
LRKRVRWVIAAAALALVCAAPASSAITTGLVAYWRLDEAGGTTAVDSSGFGNTGEVSGGAVRVEGRWGNALEFDGSTGKVFIPRSLWLERQELTVSAWVRRLGTQGEFKYIFAKGATGCNAASYGLYTGPNEGLMFYVSTDAGLFFTRSPDAGPGVWDGVWHHVAGTYDGSNVRLFVDGVEVGSGTPTTAGIDYSTTNSTDGYIGSYPGCTDHDFAGSIDDVRIWERALSGTEINEAMTELPVDPPPPPQSRCTVPGTSGNDVLTGTPRRDVICGFAGADVIRGLGGNDTLLGGGGADRLEGGRGADALEGSFGGDKLVGGRGADLLKGAVSGDRLVGGPGEDAHFGGMGRDVLVTRDGWRDRLNGGGGSDRGRIDRGLDRRISVERLF